MRLGDFLNETVTNGDLGLDPDVASGFQFFILKANQSDDIWGYLFVGVITYGVDTVFWPVLPIIIAIILLAKRKRKN